MNLKVTLMIALGFLVLSGCEVVKYAAMIDGSKADGILSFSYDVGGFEKPVVQWDAALQEATITCQKWGYSSAEWFGTATSICIATNEYGCVRSRVTQKCMCVE